MSANDDRLRRIGAASLRRDFVEARTALEGWSLAVRGLPEDAPEVVELALTRMRVDVAADLPPRTEEARRLAERAEGVVRSEALARLGSALLTELAYEEAERVLVEATRRPAHVDALLQLGFLRGPIQGDWRSSLPIYEAALEAARAHPDPSFLTRSLLGLARTLHHLGELERSEPLLAELMRVCRELDARATLVRAHQLSASLRSARGETDGAAADLEAAVTLAEEVGLRTPHLLNDLADAWLHVGRLEEAEQLLVAVVEELRGTVRAWIPVMNLARVRFARGETALAEHGARQVLEDDDRSLMSERHLAARGLLLACAGRAGDAEAWDEHHGYVDAIVVQLRPVHIELSDFLEQAARAAATRPGWGLRAARAWRLALALHEAHGRVDAAERVADELARLDWSDLPLVLDGFDLERELGAGSMGVVYAGRHHVVGAPVAVKVLTAESARHPRRVRLVQDEIRTLARLDHPGIVPILDHGVVDRVAELCSDGRLVRGSPYFAMAEVSGVSLQSLAGKRPWPEVRRMLLQLLRALSYAHARDVVHLDLKPENVLWDEERQQVVLLDFGIAAILGRGRGRLRVAGTPTTMAPEQWRGQWWTFGPWTDLYAVGCLATTLLTGRAPFRGDSVDAYRRAHEQQQPPPLRPRVTVPPGVEAWIAHLLAKDPADRYPNAALAALDLEALEGDLDDEATLMTSLEDATSRAEVTSWTPGRFGEPAPRARPELILEAAAHLASIRSTPFRGRDRELASLHARFEQVCRRRTCHGTVLVGASGAGATRLASELLIDLHERGSAWMLEARADEPELGHVLGRLFALDHAPPEDLNRRAWEVASAFGVAEGHLARRLADALGGEGDLAAVSRDLLRHMARRRPGVVLVDRADGPSPVLRDLLPLIGQDLPLFFVATAHEAPAPVRGVEVLTLSPLRRARCVAVIKDAVPVSDALARRIAELAGDLPGPALERVRGLLTSHALFFHEDRYELRPGVTLPTPGAGSPGSR